MKAPATQFAAAGSHSCTERDSATGTGGIEEGASNSLTRGPEMSNGPPKMHRDRPESDADRSRDLDELNQQVVCPDLFGSGGREEDFHPASPDVESFPSGASYDRSRGSVNDGRQG
jgi:hypothetical protein